MDANKGEAERCLREACKWQRANRPVKALKFAKKSHSLFPTPAAQQKIGELTDELQQRQANYRNPSSSLLDDAPPMENNQANPPPNREFNNLNNNQNRNVPHHDQPPPQNQEFVEIDPSQLNHGQSSMWTNIQSVEWWSLLLESIFGPIFESLHSVIAPVVPLSLSAFRLRFRTKVWALLLLTIVLLLTRFVIVQQPFGTETTNRRLYRDNYEHYEDGEYNGHSNRYSSPDNSQKSEFERTKEKFEAKYGSRSGSNAENAYRNHDSYHSERTNDRRHHEYDNYGSYDRRNRDRYDRYDSYDRRSNTRYDNRYGSGSSYSSSFSGINLLYLFIIVMMVGGMMGNNRGNGMNWNLMAMLPMLMGGPGIGFGFGRRGMFGRRRMFGRRGRFF